MYEIKININVVYAIKHRLNIHLITAHNYKEGMTDIDQD